MVPTLNISLILHVQNTAINPYQLKPNFREQSAFILLHTIFNYSHLPDPRSRIDLLNPFPLLPLFIWSIQLSQKATERGSDLIPTVGYVVWATELGGEANWQLLLRSDDINVNTEYPKMLAVEFGIFGGFKNIFSVLSRFIICATIPCAKWLCSRIDIAILSPRYHCNVVSGAMT